MLSFDPVYPITDSGNRRGWSHRRLARCFLEAGVRLFQVREKALADRVLLEELAEIRRLCRGRGARFVVNDRLDLALAGGADGMDFIRTLIDKAAAHMTDHAVLVLEIGNEWPHFDAAFPRLESVWLPTSAGEDQVLLLTRESLPGT